jgi:hypothetical protein
MQVTVALSDCQSLHSGAVAAASSFDTRGPIGARKLAATALVLRGRIPFCARVHPDHTIETIQGPSARSVASAASRASREFPTFDAAFRVETEGIRQKFIGSGDIGEYGR